MLCHVMKADETRETERLKKRHYLQERIKERQKTSAILLYNKKLTFDSWRF